MVRLIDLHTHSTASDGSDSPACLVKKAVELNICALALTDHDTTKGLDEAEKAAAGHLEFIRGCEISVRDAKREWHLLGLFLPHSVSMLEARLDSVRKMREERNLIIMDKLKHLGMELPYEAVIVEAGGKKEGTVIGRPHIAKALMRAGFVKDSREAFGKYLGAGGLAYEPKKALSPEDGVRLLADSGATPVLAHPLLSHRVRPAIEDFILRLMDYGLDSLEVWHPEHSQADVDYLGSLAKKFNLGMSGGSDYHGDTKPYIRLGRGRGSLRLGPQVLDNLKERRVRKGLPV